METAPLAFWQRVLEIWNDELKEPFLRTIASGASSRVAGCDYIRGLLGSVGRNTARHGDRDTHEADLAGTLPRRASYLHQRTAGRIGSLARLIRQAAITAICDGTERITKKSAGRHPARPPRRRSKAPPPSDNGMMRT